MNTLTESALSPYDTAVACADAGETTCAILAARMVSMYQTARDNVGKPVALVGILDGILSGVWASQIAAVRQASADGDEDKAKQLKMELPGFTAAGTFSPTRKKSSLAQASGLLVIDIDDLESLEKAGDIRDQLGADRHALVAFVSPSGRGVKAIFYIGTCADDEEAKSAWRALAEYLAKTYDLGVDVSGKDICRLCFVSHDRGLVINYNPIAPFTGRMDVPKPKPAPAPALTAKASHKASQAPDEGVVRDAVAVLDAGCNRADWLAIGCAIKNGLGDSGFQIFDSWSATSSEKYSAIESRKLWDSIDADGGITIGTLFHKAEGAGWINPGGRVAREMSVQRHREAAEQLKAAGEAEAAQGSGGALVDTYPPIRFGQLQILKVDPDANYIAGNGWLRRGAWSLFTGGTGIGKSIAVEQVAACVACGKSVFGLKVSRPFKVLLLTAENDEETLKRDLEAIADHEGLDPVLLDENLQIHHAYALDGRELVDSLNAEMKSGGFDLLILDNYQSFSGDDINGSKEWKAFITPLSKMLKELRGAMLLVDHTGKPTERKGWGVNDSVYLAAGTSRKSNGARTSAELYSPTDGDTRYRLHFGKCWERTGIYDENGCMVRDVFLDRSPSATRPYWTPSENQAPVVMGRGNRPIVEISEDEAMALLGGVAYTTEQTKTKLRAAGASRDGATDHIRRLLVAGKLFSWSPSIPHPPTYIGTKEAIEKVKADFAERSQGKLALGNEQTSQTSQTPRRKSGKSRRP